ncbi:MAR-binding filament-like protein 1 isoform X2 [Fundulus heteroclitus]|uniref:MAR-binding filament-like protein 1 isoform X2 n=1 Tax=Fundulus heteroclitus TaxID=8078 RepID=UPI00165AB396|nr:MAR-binding filament-like protein 1 isoform X2 [Fundulus heteroclitus]
MMENCQEDTEKNFQDLYTQLSAEVKALEGRYARTTQENEQLRETLYHMEHQLEMREKKHQDQKNQLSEEIAHLGHKIHTLRSLNNHLMDEEEEIMEHESSLIKQNANLKIEVGSLKSKIAAAVEDTKNLKAKYCKEVQNLRYQLEQAEEVTLNLEEIKAKQDAKIAQNECLIDELCTLTESLRDTIRNLKRQMELTQEDKLLHNKATQSLRDEFEALGETMDQEITQNPVVESQHQAQTVKAEKSTQMDTLSCELKQPKTLTEKSTQADTLSCELKQPNTLTKKSTQADTLSCELNQPKTLTEKSTKTQTLSCELKQPNTLTEKSKQAATLSCELKQPKTLTEKSTKTQTLSCELKRPKTLTEKSTKKQTLSRGPKQPKSLAEKTSQTETLRLNKQAPSAKSGRWWRCCAEGLLVIGKYIILGTGQVGMTVMAYEMVNSLCFMHKEIVF